MNTFKKKILVLGGTGMLGSALTKILSNEKIKFIATARKKKLGYYKYNALKDNLGSLPKVDYIINCIGIINKLIIKININEAIYVNSLFPRILSNYCEKKKIKLIHITTDCVFSGKKGNYNEFDDHDCIDIYGKTKSLGEPSNCMVIRTSIIGEEIFNKRSLIEWLKLNKEKQINGYTNHYWNGLTTRHLSQQLVKIIKKNLFKKDLFHVFSNETVSKYELIKKINKKFKLNCKIKKYKTLESTDRSLDSKKKLQKKLKIININQQIDDIRG
jgi:dTDP-4-dehydrorhamnose reductase